MPVTTPNKHYWSAPVGNVEFMCGLIEAICGAHATVTSTVAWTVIDSWDGTTREVPSGGLLANSTTKWAPGGVIPPANSWIVLQSKPGRVAAVHQTKWTNNGGTPEVQLIPYADWTVGGGTGNSPTLPSRITAATSMSTTTATAARATVWDEGMVALMSLNTADANQSSVYIGELDPRCSEAEDPRPFVHVGTSGSWASGTWRRISPVNDTTLLSGATMIATGELAPSSAPIGWPIFAIPVTFATASHSHYAGIARHIAASYDLASNTKTTFGLTAGVRDWCGFRPSGNSRLMRHDGTTLTADLIRGSSSLELDPPTGYPLVRKHPQVVRVR